MRKGFRHHVNGFLLPPQTPLGVEEQISLRGAEVEVASDYTKRRNVLRLATPGGSQLLLQADTPPEMLAWLSTLHNNCAIQVSTHHGFPHSSPSPCNLITPVSQVSVTWLRHLHPTTWPELVQESLFLSQGINPNLFNLLTLLSRPATRPGSHSPPRPSQVASLGTCLHCL